MSSEVTRGARPSDGSSRSSTFGWAMRARAMASIWRSPPDSVAQYFFRRSASAGNCAYWVSRPSARFTLLASAPRRRLSSTVNSAMTPRPSGTCAKPSRHMFSVGMRSNDFSPRRMFPLWGVTSPEMARRRVVFPAPFAPSTAVMRPGEACKLTLRSAFTAP